MELAPREDGRGVAFDPFVAGLSIDAVAYGTVNLQPVAERFDVFGPRDAPQGGVVHENLTVHTQDVEKAQIGFSDRGSFFFCQIVCFDQTIEIIIISPANIRVPVELIEKFF